MASKRKVITLETKYQIVTAVDANKQYKKQIADEFGISLSTILKSKDKILKAYHSSDFGSARKKLCTAGYKDVENALFEWFKSARDENIPLSGSMLAIKADELAKKLGHADFSVSQSWVERFKHCRGIVYRKVCGESESINSDVLDDYITTKLPSLLIGYQPRDIFNINETGLFYKLLPNRTLALKGEECHGGKHSKERITLLVGSNMDGSEKLKLLVIGKTKQPRCFKGVKALPVDYEGNTKAWITGDIFKDWVIKFNKKMQQEKRKVLLFVDNCPAHPRIDNLQATTMVFLPPNTTSKLQPMDQGIIKCLKQHYRRQLIQHMLNCFERKQDTVINLHQGITFAHSAWRKVSSKCISACFRKAGFVISGQTTDSDLVNYPPHLSGEEDDDDEEDNLPLSALKSMWLEVQSKLQMSENINLDDYVDVDTEVVIAEKPTDDDIVASVQQKHSGQPEEDSEDEDKGTDLPKTRTFTEVLDSLACLRDYVSTQADMSDLLFDRLAEFTDIVMAGCYHQQKQMKITDFVKST
ncbi:tigger transposable element-derived protein 4-like [Latimeria chalumnae]|uniref:tigger transposable element-derived protein 4-like n=1 Tax=Latimeria chalumnae TaxID=7897 RepID=UPI00313D8F95